MFKSRRIKLSIPNDLVFAELAATNAERVSRVLGFGDEAAREIEMSVEEVLSDIIKNAFEPGREDVVDIVFNLKNTGLEVIIEEKGMPRDPDLETEYSPEKVQETWSGKGLGLYLAKKVMDKLSFHNLGKLGRETRLFKYLDLNKVDSILSREELEKAREEGRAESSRRGDVKYTVRRLRPEEAVEVSRCVYTAYGYTYLHEDMYYPDRVRRLNENGNLVSFVAVTDDGQVIAHAAMIIGDDPLVPEFGVAATKPAFRGQGCLNVLSEARIEEARQRGFTGGFGMGVTSHFYSQKSMLKRGMKPCALLLSNAAEPEYKDMKKREIQRESAVMQFKYLKAPGDVVVYPPQRHAEFVERIYSNLGVGARLQEAGEYERPSDQRSTMESKMDTDRITADIKIKEYGRDVVRETASKLEFLGPDAVKTVYLYLPLSDPGTAVYCPELEELGFFFAGIKPGSKGDFLILQHLNGYEMDFEQIAVGCEFSGEIKEYVRKYAELSKN